MTNRPTQEFVVASVALDPETGCWLWQRYIQSHGYGQAEVCGKLWLAHRLSWTVFNGAIRKGLLVLHKCDNPPCCNPEHLFLGTHRDNFADAVAKGRHSGSIPIEACRKRRLRKLSDDAVRDIRTGRLSDTDYARLYGIRRSYACDVRRRVAKRLIPDDPRA